MNPKMAVHSDQLNRLQDFLNKVGLGYGRRASNMKFAFDRSFNDFFVDILVDRA